MALLFSCILEHGKYCIGALITEENLITLRNKLKQLIQEVGDFYEEELITFSGDLSIFSQVAKFLKRIFEIKD